MLSGLIPGIVDAHIHQWDPFTTPRETSRLAPLYRRAPGVVERLGPVLAGKADRQVILTPRHVARPYLPTTYAADVAGTAEALGVPVEAAVHVEAGWHGEDPVEETAWLETLSFGREGRPCLAAIVGRADPRDPAFAGKLDAHARASSRFRGIRTSAAWHPDRQVRNWCDQDGLLRSAAFLRGFAALAERGLTFDAFVYSRQLTDVVVLAEAHPETTIVVDHLGTPVGLFGPLGRSTGRTHSERADILARWREDIATVAEHPNVVCKLSGFAFPPIGLQTPGVSRVELAELAAPLIEHALGLFGESRVVFGSNFPMDKAVTSHAAIAGALFDLLEPHGEAVLRKAFRENAIRIYGLDVATA